MTKLNSKIVAILCAIALLVTCYGDLLGYAFPTETRTNTVSASDGNTYRITVTFDQRSGIPSGALLSVSEIVETGANAASDSYGEYVKKAAEVLGDDPEDYSFAKAFDISLIDPETGEEYQPTKDVAVMIELLDGTLSDNRGINVVHIGEDSEILDANVTGDAVEFKTDSFSVFVVTGYTVDFHWGDYTYKIVGRSSILLSELFDKLHVTSVSVRDVEKVYFSNPSLLRVDALEGDWELVSLAPFDTEETLTFELRNGEAVTMRVTDATIAEGTWDNGANGSGTWVIDEDGVMTISGTGRMKDYTRNNYWVKDTEWYEYIKDDTSPVTKIVFTNGITHIGTNSFTRACNVQEIDVTQCTTLVDAGTDVFKMTGTSTGTTRLTSVSFAGCVNLVSLGENFFSTCKNIKSIDFSGCSKLASFGNNAFYGVDKLEYLDISGTKLTSLSAFNASKEKMKTLKANLLASSITTLDLSGHTALKTVELSMNTYLTSVTLPDGIVTLNLSGCTGLTMPDLSGKTALKTLYLPLIEDIGGIPENVEDIYFDGTLREWNRIIAANGVTLPEGVRVHCAPTPDSDDLNDFVNDASLYRVGADLSAYRFSRAAIVGQLSDVITLNLAFSEMVGDGAPQFLMFDEYDAAAPLYYTLPDGVTYFNHESTVTADVSGILFIGDVTYDSVSNKLRLDWDYSGHTEQEIDQIKNANDLAFTVTVHVTLDTLPTEINFGNSYNELIFTADTPHNPLVVSKTVGEYDKINKTLTYTVVVTAEGDVDNNGNEYPVTIGDTMGSALSFVSGTVVYTHGAGFGGGTESIILGSDSSTLLTGEGSASFSAFPLTVQHMYDGDTVTVTYTVSVDTSEIEINGSPTADETGNTVELANGDNPFNRTGDDTEVCLAEIVFPELKTSMTEKTVGEDGLPVYKFVTYVSSISDTCVDAGGNLVISVLFDLETSSAELWKLCDGTNAPLASGLNKLTDSSGAAVTLSADTSTGGRAVFTLSDLKSGGEYANFYEIVYYLTPVDAAALRRIKELAVEILAGETVGEQKFVNVADVTSGTHVYDTGTEVYVYEYMPVVKTLTRVDGNWAYYEIVVNPDALTLNTGSVMVLKDTFYNTAAGYSSEYANYVSQSIDYDSVIVDNASVTYDYSGYTGTFRIPDGETVTITYRTRVSGDPGEEVTFINDAVLKDLYYAHLVSSRVIYPGSDDLEVKEGNFIKLFKYAEGHMESGLSGATFILLDADQQPVKYRRGANVGQEVLFTTEDGTGELKKGYAKIYLDEETDGISLKKNTVYYLEEVTAPVDGTVYYKKDSTLYSFMISDNPNYASGGVYTYFNGDVLKVRNYEEEKGVFVNKRFTGNATLTAAEKNNISFILQKKSGESWVDVETISYEGNFRYGYESFNTGSASPAAPYGALEIGATYRVVEVGADVENATLYTNWIISHVGPAGEWISQTVPTTGNSVEFTVDEYNVEHCIDILCDNKYVVNKITIKTVDEEDGKAQKGATFMVYNVSDQIIQSYSLTDDDGITEIRKTNVFKYDTLYYVVETKAPVGYLLPEEPERIYFYFSDPNSLEPWEPEGVQAVNLTTSYTSVNVKNSKRSVNIPVLSVWDLSGGNAWPEGIDHITVGLYRSTNGSETVPVTNEAGDEMILRLTPGIPYSAAFSDLTAVDAAGNRITYTVRELGIYTDAAESHNMMARYSPSYSVTDSGVYIVKNAEGVSVHVVKEWYDDSDNRITDPVLLSRKQDISFDIYRSTSELAAGNSASGTKVDLKLYLFSSDQDNCSMTVYTGAGDTILAPSVTYPITEVACDYLKDLDLNDIITFTFSCIPDQQIAFASDAWDSYNVLMPEVSGQTESLSFTVGEFIGLGSADENAHAGVYLRSYYGHNSVTITVTEASDSLLTRSEIESCLSTDLELVESGLVLGNAENWEKTIGSLAKYDNSGNEYLYYILETENSALTDIYGVVPETGAEVRQLKIRNTGDVPPICKIDDSVFFSLKEAMNYIVDHDLSEAVIEMLVDYIQPASDAIVIPNGYTVTLTTASVTDGTDPFTPPASDPTRETAIISRYATFTDAPMITNRGTLILENIVIDGCGVPVNRSMIETEGSLEIGVGAEMKNANNSGNGGAVFLKDGTVTVRGGKITDNTADRGGAVYAESLGRIEIVDKTYDSGTPDGSVISGNTAYEGGAIYNGGTAIIEVTGNSRFAGNTAVDGGNGGAIYAAGGSINIEDSATFFGNKSLLGSGGAIFANSGVISIVSGSFSGNEAQQNGGAICTESGSLTVSGGSILGNKALHANGGALYSGSGTVSISAGEINQNYAKEGFGGAVWLGSGTLNFSGGSLGGEYANGALNGAAIFVDSGTVNFTGGTVTNNISPEGGAVGVGSENARLYFSGGIKVSGNKRCSADYLTVYATQPSNVYLDKDTDAIINSKGLSSSAYVGVYVPDEVTINGETVDLMNRRGVPGTRFGTYTTDTNWKKFVNDRISVDSYTEVSSKKLMWNKEIAVELRYLASYGNGMPPKINGSWAGESKYTSSKYTPKISSGAVSLLAEDLYNIATNKPSATSAFGGAYAFNDANEFGDYLTTIEWDRNRDNGNGTYGAWKFTKRNGESLYCTKIVVFFAEPAYISIENNTNLSDVGKERSFTITSLKIDLNTGSGVNWKQVINDSSSDVDYGYGYVVSKDGGTRGSLLPLSAADCTLAPGGSIKLMIPGGCGMDYTIKGDFQALDGDTSESGITVFNTGASEGTYSKNENVLLRDISDPGLSHRTLAATGKTHEIIFEARKPICKIVRQTEVSGAEEDTSVLVHAHTAGVGYEYLFSTIKDAVKFTEEHGLKVSVNGTEVPGAQIEMLVDYLLPATDKVELKSGYDFTFTTAKKTGEQVFFYAGDSGRAVISRDAGNKNSLISFNGTPAGLATSSLTIINLGFDGKNLAGNSDGGAVKTLDCKVTIEDVTFENFIAGNGGAVYLEFGKKTSEKYKFDELISAGTFDNATVTIKNTDFYDCQSASTLNRQGGGAVWTTAKELVIRNCSFEDCVAYDQGGGVFHRMDLYVANTKTELYGCTFRGSEARAAGAIETDTSNVYLENCKFYNCIATQRNGGALNIYSNNSSTTADPSTVTVRDCYFENCHADDGTGQTCHGGGLRSAALKTTVVNSKFVRCSSLRGGGIAISNTNAATLAVIDSCTVNNCTAVFVTNTAENTGSSGRGGGIYCLARSFYVNYEEDTANPGTFVETGRETSIANCTAGQEGGGIYHGGNIVFKAAGCFVTGSSAGTAGTEFNSGGGVHTAAPTAEFKECTIRDNTAMGRGGGINQSGTTNMIVDQCIIAGNMARVRGGGIYTAAQLTLRNDTYIISNQLSGTDVQNAAGVFLGPSNNRTLTVGSAERADANVSDASTVKDNYTTSGEPSDVRLSMTSDNKNTTSSVKVLCGLSGEILVVNAAVKQSQFGSSTIDDPAGFTDLKHVFRADDGSLFGVVDRMNAKKLIWSGDPICKITDENGKMLYFKDGNSAIFDALDVSNASPSNPNKNSAFGLLRYDDPDLYTDTEGKHKYTGTTYCVKMLVEEYTLNNYVTSKAIAGRTVILTTAGTTDSDGYTFKGTAGTVARLIRGSSAGESNLIIARLNLTIQNIVIDGGVGNGVEVKTNTRCLYVDSSAVVTLGKNAVVQNSSATGDGGAVSVNSGTFKMEGGTIQNCTSGGNGGAITVVGNSSYLTISSDSTIRNCTAGGNGGAVYKAGNKTFTFSGGLIANCRSNGGSGGGVYVAAGTFDMTGGTVTGCGFNSVRTVVTTAGGGVFVANGAKMNMSGGSLRTNGAKVHGGGIAVGGGNDSTAKLTFSGSAEVIENTLASGAKCNVELDQDNKGIINSAGLDGTALIGVYVTGETEPDLGTGLFATRGNTGQIFGSWSNSANLRCFVNDRNNLRGGVSAGEVDSDIHWIQIYFLTVSKTVLSDSSADNDKLFTFHIQLHGTGRDIEDNVVSYDEITNVNNLYGEIPFVNGSATIQLKHGESMTAENLPGGLTFTVTEVLTDEDKAYYTTIPGKDPDGNIRITGTIGKNAEGKTDYLSLAQFINIHAVCKITSNADGLLYYRTGNTYEPAVYLELSSAFTAINKSGSTPLYYKDTSDGVVRYRRYNGAMNVEMLVPQYELTGAITLNSGHDVTLTTAQQNAMDGYPYAGGSSTALISRGYTGQSLLTVKGHLTLSRITVDGAGNRYHGTANGGLVKVGANGENNSGAILTIVHGSTLRNSVTNSNGGAVYVFSGASAVMTGGTVTGNVSVGNGAGIYMENNTSLLLSGDPDFGGPDVYTALDILPPGEAPGYIKGENGNFKSGALAAQTNGGVVYTLARQDIYISESNENDPATVTVTGDISAADGSIWVWATSEYHNKQLTPFARLATGITGGNLAAFRNAQPDSVTDNSTDTYLYGTIDDDTEGYVFWSGVKGSRRVVLRKINDSYFSLENAVLTVYGGKSDSPYVVKTKIGDTVVSETLEDLTSLSSGIFWIGVLPYGTYYVHETTVPDGVRQNASGWWYVLTVSETGVKVSGQKTSRPTS